MACRTSDLVLPITLIAPIDATGGAITSSYIDVSGSENFAIVVKTGVLASAMTDIAVTVKQATDTSGTSTKALVYTEAYTCLAAGKTAETVTTGSITIEADDDGKVFVIPLRQEQLDADNSFKTVAVALSTPGSNVALVSATLHLAGQRYNKTV